MFKQYSLLKVNEEMEEPLALRPVPLIGDLIPEMRSRKEWEEVISAAGSDYITPLLKSIVT